MVTAVDEGGDRVSLGWQWSEQFSVSSLLPSEGGDRVLVGHRIK